jgi:hypothetical protein
MDSSDEKVRELAITLISFLGSTHGTLMGE